MQDTLIHIAEWCKGDGLWISLAVIGITLSNLESHPKWPLP